MGNHYIPQYYLRGFCPGFGRTIWVYDKQKARKFQTQIKSIANICGLYPQELEKYLAEDIENPANQVLDKIHGREPLTPGDKITFSNYIAVMWKRVPETKNRLKKSAPEIIAGLREKFHRDLDEAVSKGLANADFAQRRKQEIDEILDRFSNEPPADIWHQVIPIERSPEITASLATMTWRFITFDEKQVFLTGDNPVFFHSNLGIGSPESELSFPISSHVTLWATRRIDLAEGYLPGRMSFVKEMNRRIASLATRFVFQGEDEDWILPFVMKKYRRLNIIR